MAKNIAGILNKIKKPLVGGIIGSMLISSIPKILFADSKKDLVYRHSISKEDYEKINLEYIIDDKNFKISENGKLLMIPIIRSYKVNSNKNEPASNIPIKYTGSSIFFDGSELDKTDSEGYVYLRPKIGKVKSYDGSWPIYQNRFILYDYDHIKYNNFMEDMTIPLRDIFMNKLREDDNMHWESYDGGRISTFVEGDNVLNDREYVSPLVESITDDDVKNFVRNFVYNHVEEKSGTFFLTVKDKNTRIGIENVHFEEKKYRDFKKIFNIIFNGELLDYAVSWAESHQGNKNNAIWNHPNTSSGGYISFGAYPGEYIFGITHPNYNYKELHVTLKEKEYLDKVIYLDELGKKVRVKEVSE